MRLSYSTILGVNLVLAMLFGRVLANQSVSRYTPFIQRPSDITIKHGHSKVSLALISSSIATAEKRYGGRTGVPELWGKYDLNDVVASYTTVNPAAASPFDLVTGAAPFKDLKSPFTINSKTGVFGFSTGIEQNTGLGGFELGAHIGFMQIRSHARYGFDKRLADQAYTNLIAAELRRYPGLTQDEYQALREREEERQSLILDAVRRQLHSDLGVQSNIWSAQTPTDLDLHARYTHKFDYVLLMKSITLAAQLGTIVPTSNKMKINNPLTFPIGSNGHWGLYGETYATFELRQDWTLGFVLSLAGLLPKDHTIRLSVENEPTIFSALVDRVRIKPGKTFKFSGYFTKGNLTDGLDFQARYTYLRHSEDDVLDRRADKTIQCYLDNPEIVASKRNLSRWRAHYISFGLNYDLSEAKIVKKEYQKLIAPSLFVVYDMPMQGNAAAKSHTVHFGAELQF